tara:strand:+ start:446 stop:577 length:132 start_codon:yes stop_codon:yes gene_type:complete
LLYQQTNEFRFNISSSLAAAVAQRAIVLAAVERVDIEIARLEN